MRIGIIGAGQLGQMLGFAARELGDSCTFVDPGTSPPAAEAGEILQAAFDDPAALARLAATSDVVSYEFENVPVDALLGITDQVPVYPPPEALRQAQDRLAEKRLFERLEIPLPAYQAIDSLADLESAIATIGLPLVIKTRRLGYDGKGQAILRDSEQAAALLEQLGPVDLIAEQWVPFDFEVSAIGARSTRGDVVVYPLTENRHADGILRESRAPVDNPELASLAADYMSRLLNHLDYVGVLALELFVVGEQLLANEFAPRVHNSGHWTIEGVAASQFHNHILAVTGRELEPPTARGHAGMLNLIGKMPPADALPACGQLHNYGKAPRPGRKLGHITVVAESATERDRQLAEIVDFVTKSTAG
mgnify:CR=1 FL=1